MFMKEGIS